MKQNIQKFGDREFKIEPEINIIKQGDIEELEIQKIPFNVFNKNEISLEEYNLESDDENIIEIDETNKMRIIAKNAGTAHIKITDQKANKTVILTRIVIEQEKDRIEETLDKKRDSSWPE